MGQDKLEKADFDSIEAGIQKKLRNKKKKLDKILQTEMKIKNKEIEPTEDQKEMIASKGKIETQIKELNEIRNDVRKE